MPATDSPKADLLSIIPKADLISSKAMALIVSLFMVINCSNSTYHGMFQDNNEELVCRAMASFVISSPPTLAPRKLTHTTALFTTPERQQKYYVVSAGKRTGVFDSWLYLTLLILIPLSYAF
jgi:hypothetical protein